MDGTVAGVIGTAGSARRRRQAAVGCFLLVVIAAAASGANFVARAVSDLPPTSAPRDLVADAQAGKWPVAELTGDRLTHLTSTMAVTVPDDPMLLIEIRTTLDETTTDYVFVDAGAVTATDGLVALLIAFGSSVDPSGAASAAALVTDRLADSGVTATTSSTQTMSFEFHADVTPGSPASGVEGGLSPSGTERIGDLMPDNGTWAVQVDENAVGLVYRGAVLSTDTLRTLRLVLATEAGVDVVDVSVLPGG